MNGDTHRRCAARVVRIGNRSVGTNAKGVGEHPAAPLRAARRLGAITAKGYLGQARPPALQAPPQGRRARLPALAPVDDVRRTTRRARRRRRTSRSDRRSASSGARARLADRVPGRRLRGRRVHRELPRDDRRDLDADRQASLAAGPAPEDGLVARGVATTSSCCTAWDGSGSPRSTGHGRLRCGRQRDRLADRVVARSCGRRRLLRRAGTGRVYALDLARGSSAGRSRAARRSPRAPRSGGRRSSSATTAAACSRSASARAGRAGRAPSTAGSTARPRSPTGRVFVPSSTGRLADRVLDLRPLRSGASAPARTSTPRRRSGPAASTSARTTGASTRSRASSGRVLWSVRAGGPISGAPSSSAASRTRARPRLDRRRGRAVRPRPPPLPARRVRPGLRQRPPAAPPRVLADLSRSTRAAMKRALLGWARSLLVARRRPPRRPPLPAGPGRPRLLDGGVRHDRGAPPATVPEPGRLLADVRLRRRAAPDRRLPAPAAVQDRVGLRRAHARRVPARDRLRPPLLHEQLGRLYAVNAKTGKRAWKNAPGAVRGASPAVCEPLVIQTFLAPSARATAASRRA